MGDIPIPEVFHPMWISRLTRLLTGGGLAAGALFAVPAVSSAAAHPSAVPTVSSAGATRSPGARTRLALPAPSGPNGVGTVALHLVDRSRPDPWVASQPYRELMISVLYPARDAARYPVAPQMTPGAARHFDASLATVHQGWGVPAGKVDWGATPTHAHLGAPAEAGRHPVILYSPGLGDPRTLGTTLTEDLASRGYVVVTIDHPSDASEVEFPGGRVVPFGLPLDGDVIATLKKVLSTRVADTRFVLDRLDDLSAGRDPDADGKRLPSGLSGALDMRHIGMFGQSAGGFTALQTLHDDPRVAAAADLDGTVGFDQDDGGPGLSPLAEDGLKRPFLLMGSQASDHRTVRSWEALWSNSTGWRRDVHLRGSKHASYTDLESLLPRIPGVPAQARYDDIGWIAPAHAVTTERTGLAGFFDHELR
jgi:dienelactone hydrolase